MYIEMVAVFLVWIACYFKQEKITYPRPQSSCSQFWDCNRRLRKNRSPNMRLLISMPFCVFLLFLYKYKEWHENQVSNVLRSTFTKSRIGVPKLRSAMTAVPNMQFSQQANMLFWVTIYLLQIKQICSFMHVQIL